MAKRIFQAPLKQWSGPYSSGSSQLLVYVTAVIPGTVPPLESIYNQVVVDLLHARKQKARDTYYQQLQQKYRYIQPKALNTEAGA